MPLVRMFLLAITKTLTKVFGLATVSLFGRTPSRDADRMAMIGLLALTWLPTLVAVAVPDAAEAMIPFAPDDDATLRLIAVASAVAIPLAVGAIVSRLHNHRELLAEHGSAHTARELLRGFRYVPVIGLTVTAVLLVLPFMAASRIVRGYEVGRLMVLVPGGRRHAAIGHLRDVLDAHDHHAEEVSPPAPVGLLFRWLGHVLGDIFRLDVAPELTLLRGQDRDGEPFEVTLHAADLAIIGPREQVTRVHAALAEGLDLRIVGATWDEASRAIETRIGELRGDLEASEEVPLDAIDDLVVELDGTSLDSESWSAVRRSLHALERDVLCARLDLPIDGPVQRDDAAVSDAGGTTSTARG